MATTVADEVKSFVAHVPITVRPLSSEAVKASETK
jgi:hypothetical protein